MGRFEESYIMTILPSVELRDLRVSVVKTYKIIT